MDIVLRDAQAEDLEVCLALNEANLPHVSTLTLGEFARLQQESCYCKVAELAGEFGGFLLAFDRSADYHSVNFLWFREHYTSFAYIDRIVIAPSARRKGVAGKLYKDLEQFAAQRGFTELTCEYNLRPENRQSEAFHAELGFFEVGRQETEGGKKLVSLQCKQM